jgi:hypothetical protein
MHRALATLVALCACTASTANAQVFEPALVEDVDVVEIITQDEDGDARETKVWIVEVEGEAYLRTNDSRWLENLRRDPNARLSIAGTVYPVVTEVLLGPSWIEKVDAASASKYGWQERMIHVIRLGEPAIIRVRPRAQTDRGEAVNR